MKNTLTYDEIEISPLPNDKFVVIKDIIYKDVLIKKGYTTNGADIPRLIWSIWPPNRSSYLPAVIIHDYLCDKEEYKKADKYFKEILESINVDKVTIWFFYNFVRLFHKVRYRS